MVMIQVLIAEVRLNDTDEFGVELGLQDSLLFDRSLLDDDADDDHDDDADQHGPSGDRHQHDSKTIINATAQSGLQFQQHGMPLGNNGSTTALATARQRRRARTLQLRDGPGEPRPGLRRVHLLGVEQRRERAACGRCRKSGGWKCLSRPQIMALDGQPGYILVGQRVPTITGVTLDHVRPDEQHPVSAGRHHPAGHAADQPRRPGRDADHDGKVGSRAGSGRHSDLGLGERADRAGAADQRHDGGHHGQRAERPDGGAERPA